MTLKEHEAEHEIRALKHTWMACILDRLQERIRDNNLKWQEILDGISQNAYQSTKLGGTYVPAGGINDQYLRQVAQRARGFHSSLDEKLQAWVSELENELGEKATLGHDQLVRYLRNRSITETELKRKLPRQVDSLKVEFFPASSRSRNTAGGRFPSASWGRSSL